MLEPQPDHDGRESRTQPDRSQARGEEATASTEICPSRTGSGSHADLSSCISPSEDGLQ
jgi:hypothetical protein